MKIQKSVWKNWRGNDDMCTTANKSIVASGVDTTHHQLTGSISVGGYLLQQVLVAMLIALLTVSFQAFKAAIANPVKSLRME